LSPNILGDNYPNTRGPEDSVFIGDGGSNELYGAKQIGLSTIMITGLIKEIWPDKIEAIKTYADYVIENIDELI
jgi:putative hydrolase of the HAD superfamily